MKTTRIAFCLTFIMWFLNTSVQSQDIHFSQFFNSPMNINPGMAGIFNGEKQLQMGYRNQWTTVPVPYTTFTVAYDQKIYPKYDDKYFWGIGFLANYDYSGDSRLTSSNINIIGNYAYLINERNIISLGLSINGDQRRFNEDELRWGNQWNGDSFDPNRATGEKYTQTSFLFFDVGAGLNYRFQKSNRTWINIGGGLFHIIKPLQSFYENDDNPNLPFRLSGVLTSSFKLGNGFDILFNGLYQKQDVYEEVVVSAIGRIFISNKLGNQLALDLGIGTRLNDALIFMVGLNKQNWYIGLSYDYTNSGFDLVNDGRGGPEFHFRYNIFRVDPLKEFKKCPIY